MAEFLIRVHDKVNAEDPVKNRRCSKRADVIVACPDGHPWSEFERTLPYWRIVKVPGMPMDEAEAFTASEPGARRSDPELRSRAFRFDLDALSNQAWLADDSRKVPAITLNHDDARSFKKLKPQRVRPDVIG
jgi:hypothetical protein